jgi:hypothetical protein
MDLSLGLSFQSERFDYTSDLPSDANAGNRFYGRDLAAFLAQGLSNRGFPSDSMDEDWGWLVFATRGAAENFEIAVYNLSEHREGGRPGANRWGLWVRQHVRKKVLGLFPKRSEVPVSAALLSAVSACVEESGATPNQWQMDE